MEIPDELKQQCMSIFKYVRDCYGTEVSKSVLFREFNISENNKEKIFKFLESNGIKFVRNSKEPQKKGLGQKKGAFELPSYDSPYDDFSSYGYNPPTRKATTITEGKISTSKSSAKSLADSIVKRTAEKMAAEKAKEAKIIDAVRRGLQNGQYGGFKKQF